MTGLATPGCERHKAPRRASPRPRRPLDWLSGVRSALIRSAFDIDGLCAASAAGLCHAEF